MTWAKLSPSTKNGGAPRQTGRFAKSAFLSNLATGTAKKVNPSRKASPVSSGPSSADDDLLKQMASEAVNNTDVHVAYPVSAAEVAWNARIAAVPVMYSPRLVVPPVKVGQKWPAAKGGYRIVMAMAPPDVYFITESGRTYSENMQGWEDDYVALIYSSVAESLGPLETILDVEADFLLGAISATGMAGAVAVIGLSATQWALGNKEKIVKIGEAIAVVYAARKVFKKLAPNFYDKVFWAVLGKVLAQLPESLSSDPKTLAKLAGQLIVALGKVALERDPSAFIEIAKPIIKELLKGLKAGIEYGGIAAVKSIPGAAKLAAAKESMGVMKDGLLKGMAQAGISLSSDDAEQIVKEIVAHPKEIVGQLQDLEDAFKDLTFD
jgi:hypothetical protein